ncbi:MAG: TldD/PmbA family protein [Candidatus Obscuribacterales bacterium]
MLNESQCRKIIDAAIEHALKHSSKKKPIEVEVSITGSNLATSRFANNEMTQNQAPDANVVAVRLLRDGRQARLETLDLSESGIERLVESALEAVRLLEADEDILPLVSLKEIARALNKANVDKAESDKEKSGKAKKTSGTVAEIDRYDPATAELTALDRAKQVGKIIKQAEAEDVSAAGVYCSGASYIAIGNSNGLFQFHQESTAACSITITADGATSWVLDHGPDARTVKSEVLAERAITKAKQARQPEDLPPGKYVAILEPAAVIDLLSYLWWDFSATSHIDKLSCLLDKVGEKVFGDNITVVDDVTNKNQCGCPFDGEGVPRQTIKLVENGVIKQLVHSRQSAKKMQTKTTGHSMTQPSAMGEMPLNIVIEGGISSIEDMIQQVQGDQEAVLLTRVWYVREVDPSTKLLTGMTRDGTFLVKNGAVVKPVKNLRFNVSLLQLLNNVIALGPSVRAAGAEGIEIPAVVPAMMVKDFNFTEGTRF